MAEVSLTQMNHAEQAGDAKATAGAKNQGILKSSNGNEHSVFPYSDTGSITADVSELLQEANKKEAPPESLQDFEFTHITQESIDVEHEIGELLAELDLPRNPEEGVESKASLRNSFDGSSKGAEKGAESNKNLNHHKSTNQSAKDSAPVFYKSLFSLAGDILRSKTPQKEREAGESNTSQRSAKQEDGKTTVPLPSPFFADRMHMKESRFDREGNGRQQQEKQGEEKEKREGNKEGFGQNQERRQNSDDSKEEQKKRVAGIQKPQGARSQPKQQAGSRTQASAQGSPNNKSTSSSTEQTPSVDSIFIRFMALMARILGQAEAEAHQLYLRIKERTDSIDVLTLLISKINNEKGAIDWSNNEELKALVEKARAIGVDIPEGKYKWSEEEKKLLKENIQMRKDSMEKITQLERTDMQRYLQEASQCHQARSNILKLLKEVMDTIIHNFRPS